MTQGTKHETLAAALAAVQADLQNVAKRRTVTIKHREGGAEHSFKYAPMEAVLDMLRPACAKHGLAFLQPVVTVGEGATSRAIVETILIHESGDKMSFPFQLPLGSGQDPKTFGANVTYFRRYLLGAVFALGMEDDTSAHAGKDETVDYRDEESSGKRYQKPQAAQRPAARPSNGPRPGTGTAAPQAPQAAIGKPNGNGTAPPQGDTGLDSDPATMGDLNGIRKEAGRLGLTGSALEDASHAVIGKRDWKTGTRFEAHALAHALSLQTSENMNGGNHV